MATSKPINPAPPSEALYSPEKLQLFPRLTRALYREMYGVEPPAWDPSQQIKRWFDTTAIDAGEPADLVVTYLVFDANRPGGTRVLALTAAEAATPNLPGATVYPKYVVRPTSARIVTPVTGDVDALAAEHICERADALALAAELGLGPDAVHESALYLFPIAWNEETRRPWVIQWKGNLLQASLLLKMRHASGVNAPGRWDLSGTSPVWVTESPDTGERDLRPEIPVPIRALRPDEKIVTGFGGLVSIRRETAKYLSDRELLERIDDKVGKLWTLLEE